MIFRRNGLLFCLFQMYSNNFKISNEYHGMRVNKLLEYQWFLLNFQNKEWRQCWFKYLTLNWMKSNVINTLKCSSIFQYKKNNIDGLEPMYTFPFTCIYIQTRAFPETSTGISHVILGFFSAKAIRITSLRKRWRNVMIDWSKDILSRSPKLLALFLDQFRSCNLEISSNLYRKEND